MRGGKIHPAAVVAAAVIYWIVQAGWFTLFQKQWLKGIGKTMEELQQGTNPAAGYTIALVSNLVIAYALAWVVVKTGKQTAVRGAALGAAVWLGFMATFAATNYIFEARTLQIFAINAGCPLLGMLLMGAIVGGWKRKQAEGKG